MEGKIEEDAQAIGSLKAQLRYIYRVGARNASLRVP
jgi:hypothetical protein